MHKTRNFSAQPTNRNSPQFSLNIKAKLLNLEKITTLNSSQKDSSFPSGALKVLKNGTNLHLKPRSPERYRQNFDIKVITENLDPQKSHKPFKVLKYNEPETNHTRSPTTIVNEMNQSYQFVSALSSIPDSDHSRSHISIDFSELDKGSINLEFLDVSDEILSDFSFTEQAEEPKEKGYNNISSFRSAQNSTKYSLFASTNEPKSVIDLRQTPSHRPRDERFSTIYTLSSDSSAKYVQTHTSDVTSPAIDKIKNTQTTRGTTNTLENEVEVNQDIKEFCYEKQTLNNPPLYNNKL